MKISHKKILSLFIKTISVSFLIFLIFIFISIYILAVKRPVSAKGEITWGVTFSQTFSRELGLDWKKVYIEILDDLKPSIIRLPVYWPEIEKEKGKYTFDDYDFMMNEAEKRNIAVTLAIGMRVPRWPECHIPNWAKDFKRPKMEKNLLDAITKIVNRYKDRKNLYLWQVENEPFLIYFGECPFPKTEFLDTKINLVKTLDPGRLIMVTDSGELSVWLPAAKRADVFGTTMYRTVWSKNLSKYFGYITYPLPPRFFWIKANLVELFYGDKHIVVSELQAEPWSPGYTLNKLPEKESLKSMSIDKFYKNIEYAKKVGFNEVYLWGVEWWYWKKENNNASYWQAAKELFASKENNPHKQIKK